jgi:hypothetical protein
MVYEFAVENQRFPRILCGFFHHGTKKAHKKRPSGRLRLLITLVWEFSE